MNVDKGKPNLHITRKIECHGITPPDNFETICDHRQLRKQRHGHGKAWIFCDPSAFEKSATKANDVSTMLKINNKKKCPLSILLLKEQTCSARSDMTEKLMKLTSGSSL